MFKALNPSAPKHRLAAIKLVHYVAPSSQSTRKQHPPDRRALQKEVQVHALLRHENVLQFIAAKEIGVGKDNATLARERNWVAGLYMVLEFAEGGDLFDKIRESCANRRVASSKRLERSERGSSVTHRCLILRTRSTRPRSGRGFGPLLLYPIDRCACESAYWPRPDTRFRLSITSSRHVLTSPGFFLFARTPLGILPWSRYSASRCEAGESTARQSR